MGYSVAQVADLEERVIAFPLQLLDCSRVIRIRKHCPEMDVPDRAVMAMSEHLFPEYEVQFGDDFA